MSQTFVLRKDDANRLNVAANLTAFIARLPESRSWEIEIRQHVKRRSDKQRAALFGPAYGALMAFSGLQGNSDKEELHRFFCGEFFGWAEDAFGRRKPRRTTTKNERGERDEISVVEALNFYDFLQRRGAEVGCYVPDPDPLYREQARDAA